MRKTFAILIVLATLALFTGCSDDSSSGPHRSGCVVQCMDQGKTEAHCQDACASIGK